VNSAVREWGNLALRDKAERLISDSGANSVPTNLGAILNHLGYTYFEFTPDRETQKIIGAVDHDEKTIFINGDSNDEQQHFTLAHEIAHVVLHTSENQIDFRKKLEDREESPKERAKEREANVFAYELVLPFEAFCTSWNELKGNLEKIGDKFLISPRRIKIRSEFVLKQIDAGLLPKETLLVSQ